MTNDAEARHAFNRTRRRFLQSAGLGGGALLLPKIVRGSAAPPTAQAMQIQAVQKMTFRPPSESELDVIASIDPTLHGIAQDIVSHAKYTMTAVAANAGTGDANELAEACRTYIATRKPQSRGVYATKAAAMLAAPVSARQTTFGRYAAIAPAMFIASDRTRLKTSTLQPIVPMMAMRKTNVYDSLAKLAALPAFGTDLPDLEADAAEAQAAKDAAAKAAHDADVAKGHAYKHLEFFINHIECKDNTGGVFEGTDEIAMGGAAVGATGVFHKIPEFHVMDGFDIGVKKSFPGGKNFFTFDVPVEKPWPHEYLVTLALAELDSGGFGDFLQKVWNKISFLVTGAIADAAAAGIAAAIGSVIPGLGTLIGAVVGAFIGWLVGLFHNDDDVVGSKTKKLGLHHSTGKYYDKKQLTTHDGIPVTIDLTDSGHYQIVGGWRLIKP